MAYVIRPSLVDEVMLRGGISSPLGRAFIEPLAVKTNRSSNAVTPVLNVYEDNTAFYVLGLMPGLDPNQLDINVKENILTISGEYSFSQWPQTTTSDNEHANNNFRTLLNEAPQGKFSRQLKLGATFDQERIEASYENGVLKLTLPKAQNSLPKRISLNATQS